jgi:hypothetical protein
LATLGLLVMLETMVLVVQAVTQVRQAIPATLAL